MKQYFKGWYFKQHTSDGTVAVIPAIHMDDKGQCSASVQIVTDSGSYWETFPHERFYADKKGIFVAVDKNLFSDRGVLLNIDSGQCSAHGTLHFGKLLPVKYDIMGIFKFMPRMECRHSVFSMAHQVSGTLEVNGKQYRFTDSDGIGYIEGDRGCSFPRNYAWTQCYTKIPQPCALMLSVADVPLMGTELHFTGVIGAIHWQGREYRLATYLGAKAAKVGDNTLVIRQGKYTLTAELLEKRDFPLHAPVNGDMRRFIRESPACRARYRFEKGDRVLFEFSAENAGFEFEYPASFTVK